MKHLIKYLNASQETSGTASRGTAKQISPAMAKKPSLLLNPFSKVTDSGRTLIWHECACKDVSFLIENVLQSRSHIRLQAACL